MFLFPSPPHPQKPSSCWLEMRWFLSTSLCSLLVVSTEMAKLRHFSVIIYQAFCNTWKPAQGPGESWGRLTQGIPQEVGLHSGVCKGEKEDWKRKKKTHLPMFTGFFGGGGLGRERKGNENGQKYHFWLCLAQTCQNPAPEPGLMGYICCWLERKPLAQAQSPSRSCSSVLQSILSALSIPRVWWQHTKPHPAHEPLKGEMLQTVWQMPWDVNVARQSNTKLQQQLWDVTEMLSLCRSGVWVRRMSNEAADPRVYIENRFSNWIKEDYDHGWLRPVPLLIERLRNE